MTWLIGAKAVACAMVGGIFFAFSSFVMPALGNIPAEEGVRAMQRINIDVFHWSFMGAFVVTPLAIVDTSIVDASHAWSAFTPAWTRWNHVRTFGSLAAAGLFLVALVKG